MGVLWLGWCHPQVGPSEGDYTGMKYDAAYFIAKFEAIPDELWTDKGWYYDGEKRCAIGHCVGDRNFHAPEAVALREIAKALDQTVISINDGYCDKYPQPTPKQRVLAWLRDAKEASL